MNDRNSFIGIIRKSLSKFRMINFGETVVLGVSGGADSIAMLHALNSLKGEIGFNIHVAHLDHMMRKNSNADARFVKQLSSKLGLPITIKAINVKKVIKKDSAEQVARRVRFSFLFDVAESVRAKTIALGHTKNDQAETVLMRLIRGTGLYGLSGILPVRQIDGFTIIRPLIEVSRPDIITYLKKHRLKWRIDASNKSLEYMRNRIRIKLLPLLEKEFNPGIKDTLYSLGRIAKSDYDFLDSMSQKFFKNICATSGRKNVKIDINNLTKIKGAMQRMVLRLALEKLKGDTRRLTFKHWEELEDLIYNRPANSIVDLPRQISALKHKNRIILYVRKS